MCRKLREKGAAKCDVDRRHFQSPSLSRGLAYAPISSTSVCGENRIGMLLIMVGFGECWRTANRKQLVEIRNCSLQAFREHHRRPPIQQLLCLTNIRTTLSRVVLRQRPVDDP